MKTISKSFISVSIALALIVGLGLSSFSVAQAITNEQISKQETVVKDHLFATIEEQIKLLQMILIQKLELRVEQLKAEQK